MEDRHLAVSIVIIAMISLTNGVVADSEFLIEEDLDSPETIWGSEGVGSNWIVLPENNSTVLGTFELNDSVDLYAIEISSSNWTTIRFSVSGSDSVSISIQRLNQSIWSIEEYANEDIGEISLDQGFHAIRLERLGNYEEEVDYRFIIRNMGNFDESGEYVNLAWMFAPFYIFAGLFLILPMLVVIWWNRGNILTSTFRSRELEESEMQVLSLLKERFSADRRNVDFEEINEALTTLGKDSWNAISEEFGKPEIRHFTENIDISLWRVNGGSGSFLIKDAIAAKADVFITSDMKYHDYFIADNKITIIDIGHYEGEQFTKDLIFEYLSKKFLNIALHLSNVNTNPINYYN